MRMRLLFAIASALAITVTVKAQATDSNPAHEPSVFLGNDRPKEKKDKRPTSRAVTGKVVDASGQPLEGALVTLTDPQKNEKLTFFTKKNGRYNFDDLSFTLDYGLQARFKDSASEPLKLSQYDRSPKMVRILEVPVAATPAASTEAKKETAEPKQ